LIWPAFCTAYQPLDKNPLFSRFLRTIFYSLFFFFWISPFKAQINTILLTPSLAILSGINYWLLVRRHGRGLHKIINFLVILVTTFCFGVFLFYLIPEPIWNEIPVFKYIYQSIFSSANNLNFIFKYKIWGLAQTGLGLLIGIFLFFMHYRKKSLTVWNHALLGIFIFMMIFWSIIFPFRSLNDESKTAAESIIQTLGSNYSKDMTIYTKGISGIYSLGCYMDCHFKTIQTSKLTNQLPKNEKTVYLFSTEPPILPERQWERLKKIYYKDNTLYLYKGVLVDNNPLLKI